MIEIFLIAGIRVIENYSKLKERRNLNSMKVNWARKLKCPRGAFYFLASFFPLDSISHSCFHCSWYSLLIDVKLGASKVVTLNVYDHDDPALVASKVGQIYALDPQIVELLEEEVRSKMVEKNIPLGSVHEISTCFTDEEEKPNRSEMEGTRVETDAMSDVSDDGDYTQFSTPMGKLSRQTPPKSTPSLPVQSSNGLVEVSRSSQVKATEMKTEDDEVTVDLVNEDISLF